MALFETSAKKRTIDFVKTNYTHIDVIPGKCRYNYMCHANSVHDAIKNKENKIALCFTIDGECVVIHFVNVDKKGKYIDNTLGYWADYHDYYFVRFVDESEFKDVFNIHKKLRRQMKKQLTFLERLFSGVEL